MNNLFVRNNGHFNDEIDFAGSEGLVTRLYNGTRGEFFLPSGRERARTCRTGHVGSRHSLVVLVDASRDKARALVCGHGDVGKACVFAFRGSGAHVFVPECELLCALLASFKGIQASCLRSTSLFSQRGLGLMTKLKNNATAGNSRRFWQSARLGWLRGLGLCAPMSCCQAARHVPRAFRACAADPLCTELCTRRSLLPQSLLTS